MWGRAWDRLAFTFLFSLEGFRICASRSRSTFAEPDGLQDPVRRELSSYLGTVGMPGEGCRAFGSSIGGVGRDLGGQEPEVAALQDRSASSGR